MHLAGTVNVNQLITVLIATKKLIIEIVIDKCNVCIKRAVVVTSTFIFIITQYITFYTF